MHKEINHRIRKHFNEGIYNVARYKEVKMRQQIKQNANKSKGGIISCPCLMYCYDNRKRR